MSYNFINPLSEYKEQCPLRNACQAVRTGTCTLYHRDCRYGSQCRQLAKRECSYHHPPQHFNQTPALNPFLNAVIPEPIQKLHKKPERHHKTWEKKEDAVLLKYINKFPKSNTKKKIVSQIRAELQNGRTPGAIKTRIRKIKENMNPSNDSNTNNKLSFIDNDNDDDENESDDDYDDDESTEDEEDVNIDKNDSDGSAKGDNTNNEENKMRKQEVYEMLTKLVRYSKMDNNMFDANNLEKLLNDFKEQKWNGNEHKMKDIMLNTDLTHFKEKLYKMEDKFGSIDLKMEQKIMNTIKLTKQSLKQVIKDINKAIDDIDSNNWLGTETQFVHITGYNMQYFQGILDAIKAEKEKCKNKTIETTTIKMEENDPFSNMPTLEGIAVEKEYKNDTTDNVSNTAIKVEFDENNNERIVRLDSNPYLDDDENRERDRNYNRRERDRNNRNDRKRKSRFRSRSPCHYHENHRRNRSQSRSRHSHRRRSRYRDDRRSKSRARSRSRSRGRRGSS